MESSLIIVIVTQAIRGVLDTSNTLDKRKMFERVCASDVSGLRNWCISLKIAAP